MVILSVLIKIGNISPSGPFLFFATKILPVFANLSSAVLDIEKIKSHPGEAAKLISSGEHIFADVDAIIIQHHERPDKLGFPRGLGALSISPLSCIFILASEFVDEIYGKPPHEVDIESIKAKMSDIYNVGNFKKPLEAFLKVF